MTSNGDGQRPLSGLEAPDAAARPGGPPATPPAPLPSDSAALGANLIAPRASPIQALIRDEPSFVPLPSVAPSLSPLPSVEPLPTFPNESLPPTEEYALERELVRKLRTGRAALPVLPQVAESALRLANDHDARIDQLARLVDTDPPIAARFMSVANSVAYWRGLVTASTQSAIVRLGLANTRDLLFQVVYASSTSGLKKYQTVVQRSFKRSVTTAIAARTAAQELDHKGEYDYMSGLLHNIGEARVYRILDDLAVPEFDRSLPKRLVQKYHCVAGAEIAMAWKLPTEIVDACAAHHDSKAAENPNVRLVMIADAIADGIEAGALGRAVEFTSFERLGVGIELALRLIEKTKKGIGNARAP